MINKPIETNISFADASISSFQFDEESQKLELKLEAWNEKTVKIFFYSVLFFQYQPGDFISEIYEDHSNSQIIQEALTREFEKIPSKHNYKLYFVADIYDCLVVQVVAEKVLVSTE